MKAHRYGLATAEGGEVRNCMTFSAVYSRQDHIRVTVYHSQFPFFKWTWRKKQERFSRAKSV